MLDLDLLVLTWFALCLAGIAAVVAMLWLSGRPCPMKARGASTPVKKAELDVKLRRATSAVAVLFAASLLAAR